MAEFANESVFVLSFMSSHLAKGGFFDGAAEHDGTVVGYSFVLDGYLTDTENAKSAPSKSYGESCSDNDIIEMKLDFNDLSLSYKIKGKDFGKAFDIKEGRYRAAVGLWNYNEEQKIATLISYEHIV